jgi:predicted RNA-binding Zn-ribbon protein involved in translation (DUF1610 family)
MISTLTKGGFMICPDCGNEPFEIGNGEWDCFCNHYEMAEAAGQVRDRYINHCWKCKNGIDSKYNIPSMFPGGGFHCPNCGVDLKGNHIH